MRELILLFLRLGATSFGGPAVHIALMEAEVVRRRQWLSHEEFLDLLGAANLIPGPNSTELAMHIGWRRAGWAGLVAAGAAFIIPAATITALAAWAYTRFGALPSLAAPLAGIRAAVLAVIAAAIWRLGRAPFKDRRLVLLGLLVLAASVAGVPELVLLLVGGVLGACWLAGLPRIPRGAASGLVPLLPLGLAVAGTGAAAPTLTGLALFFLRVGAVLYGSGYVLIAFLQGGLVASHGWLTGAQLTDAVAAGQFTPGPVLSTATFVGYLILGVPGALVATVAIFLPSFGFVALTSRHVHGLRKAPWAAAFLNAVNVAALALMASVLLSLGRGALVDASAWAIAIGGAVVALRWNPNPAWLILGGALLGAVTA